MHHVSIITLHLSPPCKSSTLLSIDIASLPPATENPMPRHVILAVCASVVLAVVFLALTPAVSWSRSSTPIGSAATVMNAPEECPLQFSNTYLPLAGSDVRGGPPAPTPTPEPTPEVEEVIDPIASIGQVGITGVSLTTFNPLTNSLTFTIDCATFAEESDALLMLLNDEPIDITSATATDITVTGVFTEGRNHVVLLAEDASGRAVAAETTFWAGANTLTVTVQDSDGNPVPNVEVKVALGDDKTVNASGTGANGVVTFTNLPDRTVFVDAYGPNNTFVAGSTTGGSGELLLTVRGFDPPSPIDNNDFDQGTDGWNIGNAPVVIIAHEEDFAPDSNNDLQLSTEGEGPQSISRTFTAESDSINVRYRFITSEIPGGYFGTEYNDTFSVSLRSQGANGNSSESNSMNGLGEGAFDARGATEWRTLTLDNAAGDTVQVDLTVANVADDLYDSQLVVDFVEETPLAVKADKTTACPNETVTFTPTQPVTGTIQWSGGGTPATGEGNSFATRFATNGEHTVTGTLGNRSGTATVKINELSGAAWVQRFPTSRSTADLSAGFRPAADNFISALQAAGANVRISATLRPPERAFLMHYSYRVARGGLNPAAVPAREGIDICWVHRNADGTVNLAASRAAAEAMVRAYDIVYAPALNSRHTQGNAIDMTITWTGNLVITNGNGQQVTITTTPRTGAGNTQLHTVGATFGAIKLVSDAPHWSSDGH